MAPIVGDKLQFIDYLSSKSVVLMCFYKLGECGNVILVLYKPHDGRMRGFQRIAKVDGLGQGGCFEAFSQAIAQLIEAVVLRIAPKQEAGRGRANPGKADSKRWNIPDAV